MKRILILLALLVAVCVVQADRRALLMSKRATASTPYAASATTYNGSTTYFSRTSDLSGNADSKLGTISFWVKFSGGNELRNTIICTHESGTLFLNITRLEQAFGGVFQIFARNSSGTGILDVRSTSTFTNLNTWYHVVASWDLSDTGKRHLYVNGVNELAVTTYSNDTIDYTRPNHNIGASNTPGNWLNGCESELWFAPGQYIDLSVSGNREKFRSSGGAPVDLGATGSTPTGVAPLIYLRSPHGTHEVNASGAGDFTRNGTITSCTAP